MSTLADRRYRSEIMVLLPTAMTVFVLTVVIGILNGTDIVIFDHQELLAHVGILLGLAVSATRLVAATRRPVLAD